MIFQKSKDFVSAKKTNRFFSSLIKRLKSSYLSLSYCIFSALLLIIPGIIIPSLTQVFIDDILIDKMIGRFLPLMWFMILIISFIQVGQ